MFEKKAYSPMQVKLGTLLGGPFAAMYFIKQNFGMLNEKEAGNTTLIIGGMVFIFLLILSLLLPENFGGLMIPILVAMVAGVIVEKYQFSKKDIIANKELSFHSNWEVFGISVGCLLLTFGFLLVLSYVLEPMFTGNFA